MDLMRPRNTLVLVELKKKPEEKRGQIIVKTDAEMFCEAEVLDLGPDCLSAAGGERSTHDLKPGQRVLVQYQTIQKDQMGMVRGRREQGLKLEENVTNGRKDLYLFEQTAIMAILAEPENDLKLTETD